MSEAADRVVVFMDYQNVHGWARRQFLPFGTEPADGHVFRLKIGELLTQRRRRESELMEVRVYRGRPNRNASPVLLPRTIGRRICGSVPTRSQ